MPDIIIEDIRQNFNFESSEQYNDFNQLAQEFLMKELMEEINLNDEN